MRNDTPALRHRRAVEAARRGSDRPTSSGCSMTIRVDDENEYAVFFVTV